MPLSHSQRVWAGHLERAGSGLFEPASRLQKKALRRLGRLRPPAALSSEYSLFLNQAAVEVEVLEAETQAFELGDVGAARSLQDKLEAISDTTNRSADAVGLPACSNGEPASASNPA